MLYITEVNIPKATISTEKLPERVILVAVESTRAKDNYPADSSIAELAALAYTAGSNVVGKLTQKLPAPVKNSYLGKGKIQELLNLKSRLQYDTVIVDDELTPQQQHHLEEYLQSKVVDRIALILDIFAKRARTYEGKLQVELAQYEYNLPRLTGKWSHLERLGGGIGTRGPGEAQLETDKRLMRQKITRLKKQIETVRSQRELYRQKRRRAGIPVVALVGYTNTGKSTLLNALSRSEVTVKNELFSTLDPTTRRTILPDKRTVLLTDTVGFIRKLPTTLISAFRATLEELAEANILIHVVDLTSHNAAEQSETVEGILKELDLTQKPRITALNKIDLLLSTDRIWKEGTALEYIASRCGEPGPNTVLISSTKKWGFDRLLEMISQMLGQTTVQASPETTGEFQGSRITE
ncbi:MAG: GTP-binding protein HflX [Chloroflexi bacterium]|nr:GTP-binding protein HflX [Chloroflexota bacterium]